MESWNDIQDREDMLPEEGMHEEGCDCGECRIKERASRLTEFEAFCLTWYYENVGYFTIQANVLGELVKELKLKGAKRILFFRAMDMIHVAESHIDAERQRKKTNEANR